MRSNDLFAERHQGQFHQFQMLACEGDTDDRDHEQRGKQQVDEGGVEAAEDKPDDIANDGETAHGASGGNDLAAERPQFEPREFKALHSEGDADDGDAQDDAADDIADGREEAAADQPDEIAE